jgi:hypothetical protein
MKSNHFFFKISQQAPATFMWLALISTGTVFLTFLRSAQKETF